VNAKECVFNAKLNHRMAMLYVATSPKLYSHYKAKVRYWLAQARLKR